MERQENHSNIDKVVFDYTLQQFAILRDVYRDNPSDVWLYVLEYQDGKRLERFLSEFNMNPVRYAIVEG